MKNALLKIVVVHLSNSLPTVKQASDRLSSEMQRLYATRVWYEKQVGHVYYLVQSSYILYYSGRPNRIPNLFSMICWENFPLYLKLQYD